MYYIQGKIEYQDNNELKVFNWKVKDFPDKEEAEKYCSELSNITSDMVIYREDYYKLVDAVERLTKLDSIYLDVLYNECIEVRFTDDIYYEVLEVR